MADESCAPLSVAPSESEEDEEVRKVRGSFSVPKAWILVAGWILAFCAGIVNVVSFLNFGSFTSHVTGSTTNLAMGFHEADRDKARAGYLVLSFFAGAFMCGMLVDSNHVHFGGKSWYGTALLGNSALLILATFLTNAENMTVACFTSCACGLQNSMCTTHFGAIVRTTHVTGTLTDSGTACGRIAMTMLTAALRCRALSAVDKAKMRVDALKVMILGPMWCTFLSGGALGAFLGKEELWGRRALLLPATITGVAGFLYVVFRQRFKTFIKHRQRQAPGRETSSVQLVVSLDDKMQWIIK